MALSQVRTEVEPVHPHPELEPLHEGYSPQTNQRRFQRSGTRPGQRKSAQRSGLGQVPLCDVPLVVATYDRVVELVNDTLSHPTSSPITIDALNTMGLSESCLDSRMREALDSYDMVVPDGMPLVWCMNAKGAGLTDRVYGPYLTDRVLGGLDRPTRVAVIGCFDRVHDWLRRGGSRRDPNAEVALLYYAPPRPIDEDYVSDCLERIEASDAELVFVCLGVPRQYYWTALAKPKLDCKVCISVGGAFDLICGEKKYAPNWMQRAGLTWLHRLAQEPMRLGPRYLKYNSAFIWFLFRREVLGPIYPARRHEAGHDVRRRE